MSKISAFFKGKRPSYYVMFACVVLAIFLGCFFIATQEMALAHSASTHYPDILWVFAFAGSLFGIASLIVPQYRWVNLLALACYAVSFSKELELIPPVIADEVNHVHFQGGSLPIQIIYISIQLVMLIGCIYAAFSNPLSDEAVKEAPKIKSKKGVIKSGAACGFGLVAVVLIAILVPMVANPATANAKAYDPLQAFRNQEVVYEHDPLSIKYKKGAPDGDAQKNPYEGKSSNEINAALNNRTDHWLVYEFEGKYTEAYHDDYSYNYYSIKVYEDGVYEGSNNNRGFWFNINEDGNDCLILKATSGNDMVCSKAAEGSSYAWYTDLVTGTRTCKMSGYVYYPILGIYIDTNGEIYKKDQVLEYEYGASFSHESWTVMLVRSNLSTSGVFDPEKVAWTDVNTEIVGEQTIKAAWSSYTATIPAKVGYDKQGKYEFDASSDQIKKDYRLVDLFDPTGIVLTKEVEGEKQELDPSILPYKFDIKGGKINLTLPNGKAQSIKVNFHTDEASNTITGKLNEKDATIVVTSREQIKVTVDGKSCVAKVEMEGKKGLAKIKIIEKISGDDEAFAALGKAIGIEESDGKLIIPAVKYYMSTQKANTGTGGQTGPSQTGNTYFAINSDEFCTAFWNWTYNGDECLCLKCTYTINDAGTSITLKSCLEYTRDEWQYLTRKTFDITQISLGEVPETLSSRLNLYQ